MISTETNIVDKSNDRSTDKLKTPYPPEKIISPKVHIMFAFQFLALQSIIDCLADLKICLWKPFANL